MGIFEHFPGAHEDGLQGTESNSKDDQETLVVGEISTLG